MPGPRSLLRMRLPVPWSFMACLSLVLGPFWRRAIPWGIPERLAIPGGGYIERDAYTPLQYPHATDI